MLMQSCTYNKGNYLGIGGASEVEELRGAIHFHEQGEAFVDTWLGYHETHTLRDVV